VGNLQSVLCTIRDNFFRLPFFGLVLVLDTLTLTLKSKMKNGVILFLPTTNFQIYDLCAQIRV
jgi:hypothetical protein